MRAVRAGDIKEDVLGRHAWPQCTSEIVTDRFSDAEPGLAHGDGIEHVGTTDAPGGAIEGPGGAGVRVAVHQYRAGNGIAAIGDHGVRDALVQTDVMQALDAKLSGEPAAGAMRGGGLNGGGGDQVIERDNHLGGIVQFQHLPPAFGQERHIHQHRGFHVDDSEVAWLHRRLATGAGEDLLRDGHRHVGRAPQIV